MTWQDLAACRPYPIDSFVFDTDSRTNRELSIARRVEIARTICSTCPVQQQCLESELAAMRGGAQSIGVFGASTQQERRDMIGYHRGPPRQPINHGTPGGYMTHRRRGEDACEKCRDAHTRYRQESGAQARFHAKRWTLRFVARLRAAALAESWALRREIRHEQLEAS